MNESTEFSGRGDQPEEFNSPRDAGSDIYDPEEETLWSPGVLLQEITESPLLPLDLAAALEIVLFSEFGNRGPDDERVAHFQLLLTEGMADEDPNRQATSLINAREYLHTLGISWEKLKKRALLKTALEETAGEKDEALLILERAAESYPALREVYERFDREARRRDGKSSRS